MAILVVNKYKHTPCKSDVYIGRGPNSPLGNPFPMKTEADRASVIEQYKQWLIANQNNTTVRDKLLMIKSRLQMSMDIHLVCFCSPKSCHGDIIKTVVEALLVADAYLDKVNDNT